MPFWNWSDSISVKIPSLDDQHKNLVIAINALDEAIESGKSKPVLVKIIRALRAYTQKHFKYEEGILEQNGYALLEDHQEKHQKIVEQVLYYEEKIQADSGFNIDLELLDFIKNWLVSHIMVEDKKYSEFLLEKNIQ